MMKERKEEPMKEKSQETVTFTKRELKILMKDLVKEAATVAAREAIKAYLEEAARMREQRQDSRYQNTKMLLKGYRLLKKNAENSVFGRTQMGESAQEILEAMSEIYVNEVDIESIKRSATRTAIIVGHIEAMLRIYHSYCKDSSDDLEERRYKVIEALYLTEPAKSCEEIAEEWYITMDTVYRDEREACKRLSSLIFGIDGMNLK